MWCVCLRWLFGHPSAAVRCCGRYFGPTRRCTSVRVARCGSGGHALCDCVTYALPMMHSIRNWSSQARVRRGRGSPTHKASVTPTAVALHAQHGDTLATELLRCNPLQESSVSAADDAGEPADDGMCIDEEVTRQESHGTEDEEDGAPAWDEAATAVRRQESENSDEALTDGEASGVGASHDDGADQIDEGGAQTTVAQSAGHNKQLADVFPALAAEYVAAGAVNSLPLTSLTVDAAEVVAWRCATCQQVWRCGVFVRCVLGTACPHCSACERQTVAARRPDLLRLWDVARNDPFLSPNALRIDSASSVFWQCPTCHQSFAARVRDMVKGKAKCPSCALTQIHSADELQRAESVLLQEWHPLKNGDLRFETLQPTDNKTKVWWLCSVCGHDWQATLTARLAKRRKTQGKLCPACQGKISTLTP